jgi:hypothetical protein
MEGKGDDADEAAAAAALVADPPCRPTPLSRSF